MASRSIGVQGSLTSTSSGSSKRRGGSRRPYRPRALREAGATPLKQLGQHFLTDRNVVNRIVVAAELTLDTNVIEVGPGLGALTQSLVGAARQVIAVELDAKLAAQLNETIDAPNLTVVQADVLGAQPEALLSEAGLAADAPYIVVANLPYNIGAAVLRHFLEAGQQPRYLVVMLQREVAENVVAAPGDLGLLGVSTQVYAEARRLFNVPPRAFYPPPKVTSTVIRLDVRETSLVAPSEREHFFRVLRAGFSAPRKQLRNTLAQGLSRAPADVLRAITSAGIDARLRPQDLSVDDWLRLVGAVEG